MKSALSLSPILLALAIPAVLPNPVHPNMNLWLSARQKTTFSYPATSSAYASASTIFLNPVSPKPNSVTVSYKYGPFAVISANGDVSINWPLAGDVAWHCYHDEQNTAGWEACAFAQALVQVHSHKTKTLKSAQKAVP